MNPFCEIAVEEAVRLKEKRSPRKSSLFPSAQRNVKKLCGPRSLWGLTEAYTLKYPLLVSSWFNRFKSPNWWLPRRWKRRQIWWFWAKRPSTATPIKRDRSPPRYSIGLKPLSPLQWKKTEIPSKLPAKSTAVLKLSSVPPLPLSQLISG